MNLTFQRIAGRLMRCPAAPYHEQLVVAEVQALCHETGLTPEVDAFGNMVIRLDRSRGAMPLVLAAHLDHPGFVLTKPGNLEAEFLGGVGDSFFKEGVRVLLQPGNIKATLGQRLGAGRRFKIDCCKAAAGCRFAVWDLPAFVMRDGKVIGRACDDLIGVAAVIHVLAELKKQRAKVNLIGVLSRAEEVGFHGTLALAASKRIPKRSLVISLETSRELPPAVMGQGVIIRVGDRASIFDSAATRFLAEVAGEIGRTDRTFRFQRALMSGGTCEGTAYQEYGYRTAAVCIALGSYHNCGPNDKIEPEFVSLKDAKSMVRLLETCALRMFEFRGITRRLPEKLAGLRKEALRNLKQKQRKVSSQSTA